MTPRVAALHRSNGGVPKVSIPEGQVTTAGLEGDWQRDRRFHGGPERALCLYSLELIDQLRLEGHPISPGSTGENVTIENLDWRLMVPGASLTIGAVEVELTGYAAPCKTIRSSFLDDDSTRISQKRFPGWSRVYARVVTAGVVQAGDEVALVSGPQLSSELQCDLF